MQPAPHTMHEAKKTHLHESVAPPAVIGAVRAVGEQIYHTHHRWAVVKGWWTVEKGWRTVKKGWTENKGWARIRRTAVMLMATREALDPHDLQPRWVPHAVLLLARGVDPRGHPRTVVAHAMPSLAILRNLVLTAQPLDLADPYIEHEEHTAILASLVYVSGAVDATPKHARLVTLSESTSHDRASGGFVCSVVHSDGLR